MQGVEDELHTDEGEDHRETLREVDEALQQSSDEEVQLAESHEGERVGGEDDVRLVGEAVDGRDRVDGEDEVDEADRHDDEEHRRDEASAVLLHEQAVAVVLVAHREHATDERHELAVGGVGLTVREGLAVGEEEQQRAEDVEDPGEVLDERRPHRDERTTHDERDDDADHQHLLLVDLRHREPGHDDQEHEEVVDRQRLLGEVTGVVLAAVRPARDDTDADAEEEGEDDVEHRPAGGLPDRGRVGLADVREVFEDEEGDGHRDGDSPHKGRDVQRVSRPRRERIDAKVFPISDGDRRSGRRRASVMTNPPCRGTPLGPCNSRRRPAPMAENLLWR